MAQDLLLENSSSGVVYTLPNTIYLKAIEYFEYRTERYLLNLREGCGRLKMEYCTMAVRIRDYCVGIKNAMAVVVFIFLKHIGLCAGDK